jgi:uncharacterized membrane protein
MHLLAPYYPSGYQLPGIGFFFAILAVVMAFVIVVLLTVRTSPQLQQNAEEESGEKERPGR